MVNRNIQMKNRNNGEWENLFPLTLTENVFNNSGIDLNNLLDSKASQQYVNELNEKVTTELTQTTQDLNSRGVNLLNPPAPYVACVGDGVADDTVPLNNLINDFNVILSPVDVTYRVTDTIKLQQRRKTLRGVATPSNRGANGARILYDGIVDRKKTVVLVGQNDVGEEPEIDGSGLIFENFVVDANDKAGFGVYGTFLTNETTISNIIAKRALEYGHYYARGWYAEINRLTAVKCKGNGIALGMPLEFQNGEKITWSKNAPLAMNGLYIEKLRAHSNGRIYSEDNPGTYDPTNEVHLRKGYGIGIGIGSSLTVKDYLSEHNGGVGLYVYTETQPIKKIENGYLESNAKNSGLDPSTNSPEVIIEHPIGQGRAYYIRDLFINYESGGIYFKGETGRRIWLQNVHQPRFLKSLDGLSDYELHGQVLKDNVYSKLGLYNTVEELGHTSSYKKVDTRNGFNVELLPNFGHKLLFIKGDGTKPHGSYIIEKEDGTSISKSFPNDLSTDYTLAYVFAGKNAVNIRKGGGTGEEKSEVTFKVVDVPLTTI